MAILKKPAGLASGVITDKYSKISGLSAQLHANRVRTAAISGKTSAAFSRLINDLRGGDTSKGKIDYPATGEDKDNATGLKNPIEIPKDWLTEEGLADKIQKMINGADGTGEVTTAPVDILLPSSVMNMIPLQEREALGYGVARYLAKARLVMLEAAFPGAAALLFKIAEKDKGDSGVSHEDRMDVLESIKK